jgi:hypothetical protein
VTDTVQASLTRHAGRLSFSPRGLKAARLTVIPSLGDEAPIQKAAKMSKLQASLRDARALAASRPGAEVTRLLISTRRYAVPKPTQPEELCLTANGGPS